MSKNAPFRYDFVGSFLRPAQLKQARADFESGKISEKQLEEVENEAIRDLVEKTKGSRISCDHRWRISQKLLAFGFYVGIKWS